MLLQYYLYSSETALIVDIFGASGSPPCAFVLYTIKMMRCGGWIGLITLFHQAANF